VDATPHLVVGAALGRRLHPALGFAAGFISHVVLDAIPHWNYTGWRPFSPLMVADGLVGGLLALAIARHALRPWGALAGAVGGIAPELERMLMGHPVDVFQRMGYKFDAAEIGLPWGLVTQIGVVLVALAIGLRRSRPLPGHAVTWGGPRR
jgi:hypothetical protein